MSFKESKPKVEVNITDKNDPATAYFEIGLWMLPKETSKALKKRLNEVYSTLDINRDYFLPEKQDIFIIDVPDSYDDPVYLKKGKSMFIQISLYLTSKQVELEKELSYFYKKKRDHKAPCGLLRDNLMNVAYMQEYAEEFASKV